MPEVIQSSLCLHPHMPLLSLSYVSFKYMMIYLQDEERRTSLYIVTKESHLYHQDVIFINL